MRRLQRRRTTVLALPFLLAALTVGCEAPEDGEPLPMLEEEADRPDAAPEAPVDTTAAAVWAHLTAEDYRTAWSQWPDRSAFYPGGDPHGMLLTTFLNPVAERGLEQMRAGDAQVLPNGALVVKENFHPDSTLASVTVMYKQTGYDPQHNDWFWMKRLQDGTVEASGRVGGCADCHGEAEGWDYLRTAAEQFNR